MSKIFYIKRGDTSPSLRIALPASYDLTGAVAQFQMRPRRGAIFIDQPATVETAIPAILHYDWIEGDTDMAGPYEAEFKVTYADGAIETFPNTGFITVQISDDVR
jgi:hypothetical protein